MNSRLPDSSGKDPSARNRRRRRPLSVGRRFCYRLLQGLAFVGPAVALPAAEPFLEKISLFEEATDGFRLYRIPGIIVTVNGTVLAYCEARKFTVADRGEIEIHLRRSTDGRRTWSPAKQVAHLGPRLSRNPHMPEAKQKKDMGGRGEQTVNNPIAIAGRDGTVHLLDCVEYMRCFHIRSEDEGLTWSRPVEITPAFDSFRSELDWQVIATGPGHAVQLRSRRLVAARVHRGPARARLYGGPGQPPGNGGNRETVSPVFESAHDPTRPPGPNEPDHQTQPRRRAHLAGQPTPAIGSERLQRPSRASRWNGPLLLREWRGTTAGYLAPSVAIFIAHRRTFQYRMALLWECESGTRRSREPGISKHPLTLQFMIKRKTEGLIAAPFTPMRPDRTLNLDAVDGYARWLHRHRVVGAFVCGTTGESMSLTLGERRQVAERWVTAVPAGLRVIVHVGHNSVGVCRALASHAESIGADSIGCMSPFFFKPSGVEGLVEWCEQVAAAAPRLPFYYYHIPSMTGVSVQANGFLRLAAKRIPTLAGIKFTYEDLDDFKSCLELENGRFDVLFGRDELLLSALALGARGAVGSTYNYAAPLYHALIRAHDRGDPATAAGLQALAVRMINAFLECGAHPVAAFKWFMSRVGVDCGPARLPLYDPTPEQIAALEAKLEASGIYNWVAREPSASTVTAVA